MIYMVMYVILNVLAAILRRIIGLDMPDMLMIFIAITTTMIFYTIIAFPKLKNTYSFIWKNKYRYILFSLVVLVTWVGSFLNPIYFSPSIHLFTFMIIATIVGDCGNYYTSRSKVNLLRIVIFLLNLLVFYYLLHTEYKGWNYLLLIAATLFTGVAAFFTFKFSEIFMKQSLKPAEILAIRFYLLWLFVFAASMYYHEFDKFKLSYLGLGVIAGITSLIMPLYVLQKALQKIGAGQSVLYLGIIPFICFTVEKYFFNINFGIEYICSIVYFLTVISFYLLKLKR